MEQFLCPDNSEAQIITSQTTLRDRFGAERPAVNFEMQCVDERGNIVRTPSPDYAYSWIVALMMISVGVSAVLALLLAAPSGIVISLLTHRV
ncbi:hypothetical protein [uncultured Chloroflexus sp.]|uniref:hypothetical protein n=1 Tax=uncultured Chloroflexus sp. TaxID=214040 RepID=UPI0026072B43|nr:hypothetical protein [uncultured Chloroflexus sp.]